MDNILKAVILNLTFPLIIFFGIKISLTDIFKSKIYNKDILSFLLSGLIIQTVSFFLYFTIFSKFSFIILFIFLLNAVLSFLTGFLFWYLNLWAAGDVKFFFAASINMPLGYLLSQNKFFPSFDCFINIFFLTLFFVLYEFILLLYKNLFGKNKFRFKFSTIIKNMKNKKNIFLNFIKIILSMMFMFIIIKEFKHYVIDLFFDYIRFDMIYVYILFFLFYNRLSLFLKNNTVFLITLTGLFIYIIFSIELSDYSFLKNLSAFFSIGIIISLLSRLLNSYFDKFDKKSLTVDKLSENMVVTKEYIKKLRKNINTAEEFNIITPDGINKKQVETVQKYYPADARIDIENTIPSAPFIAAGILLTIFILKNNIFEFIISLI
ncbi:MAG: hypothetical protein JXB50_15880 [Spirochaetes bacterium]|nr:hypothetical protein [Spirochaetota bacterium]